ncbi:MAG: DNA-formamidopyrimidine glycosylase family protein, partial [Alphaproteobacteria bacterium]|nr:DNA-formamidopyrimidine glycosylase family protein [Alphaproteobacteria bacterium]
MPELPEVETVRRGLVPLLKGHRFARITVRRGDLRIALPGDFASRLEGRLIETIGRRGKYLLFTLDDGQVVIGHLGMSGRLFLRPETGNQPGKHDHILFVTDEGREIVFNDVRRFGLFVVTERATLDAHPLLRDMGPDPLGNEFSGPALSKVLAVRRSTIKAL